jgi:hypothetical protein
VRAFRAKAVLLALQEQLGDLEGIVWPLTLLEGADLTREEIYQALDDLVTEDLIDLDATDTGIYVDSVLRPQQEAEFLAEAAG